MSTSPNHQWQPLCEQEDLVANAGVAAWSPLGPVALFWLPGPEPRLYCLGHFDPLGHANVLARGIVGDRQGEPVVASPLYKQHYSLVSGQCLEEPAVQVPVYPVRLHRGRVEMDLGAATLQVNAA